MHDGGPSEAAIELGEPHLAFVVVDIGQRSQGDALGVLIDLSDHIDSMPGVSTESWGSFPATERGKLTAYVEAAKALGTDRSVNEAWCRADQTRRIVEWLRGDDNGLQNGPGYAVYFAGAIAREFGGGSDAD